MVRRLYSASSLHKLASQYWSRLFQHIPNPVETSVVKPANRAIRRRGTQLNSLLVQKIEVGVAARACIDDRGEI